MDWMQTAGADQLVQDVEMEDDSSEYFFEGNTHRALQCKLPLWFV